MVNKLLKKVVDLRRILKKESYRQATPLRIMGGIATGYALSVTINGVLFSYMLWSGARVVLLSGLAAWVVVFLTAIIKGIITPSSYYRPVLKRLFLWGSAAIFFLFMPEMMWIKIQYRKHPAYIRAMEAARSDPDNKALWKKVAAEKEKMYNLHPEQ